MLILPTRNHIKRGADIPTWAVSDIITLSATPYEFDAKYFAVDNVEFHPQGIFVDNSQGAAAVRIQVNGVNYTWIVPVGAMGRIAIPAPYSAGSIYMTGSGATPITFVDYPIVSGYDWPNGEPVNAQFPGSMNVDVLNFPATQSVSFATEPSVNVDDAFWSRQKLDFMSGVGESASAGNVPMGQLWNPPGSGVYVVLETVIHNAYSNSLQDVRAFVATAPITNFKQNGANLYFGGPASKAGVYYDQTAAAVGLNYFFDYSVTQFTDFVLPISGLIIPPGYGITIIQNVQATTLIMTFRWREVVTP